MKIKFFHKKNCPRCPEAKEILSRSGVSYESFDIDTVDGMAEAAYHNVVATPSILILDEFEEEIRGWRGVSPSPEEIQEII